MDHGRSLAWVTRLSDASPVPGAKIAVLDSCDGSEYWRGVTDASGRAVVADGLPEPDGYGSCDPQSGSHPLMVSARADDDYSFTLTTWNKGIQPGDFQLPTGYGYGHAAYVTVLDRTLLRARETVSMKHIVRTRTDAGFGWVQDMPANPSVVIRHVGTDQTYELPLAFRGHGSAETRWTIPKAAALGEYTVAIGANGSTDRTTSGTFTVEEFRLPTIRARMSGPKERQIAPVAVPLDLTLAYLSGGAVGKAPVKLRTQVEPREVSVPDYDGWSFDGEPLAAGIVALNGGDEPAAQGPLRARVEPVTLGANGTARIVVDKLMPVTRPSTLVAEMDYDDANGEVATVSSRIALDPAGVRVGIKRDGWMAKSDDLRLRLVALDLDNRPVKGRRVSVKLFSRETYSYRKRLIGGFYAMTTAARPSCLTRAAAAPPTTRRCSLPSSMPASRARSWCKRARPTPAGRSRKPPAASGWRARTTGGSAATMATAWTSSPKLPNTPPAALQSSRCECRSARQPRWSACCARRHRQLRYRTVGQGPGGLGQAGARICPRWLCLGAGGARARRGLARVAGGLRAAVAPAVDQPRGDRADLADRSRQAVIPLRHRQGPRRMGRPPARGQGRDRRAKLCGAQDRAYQHRSDGAARAHSAAGQRGRLRRGRRGAAAAEGQQQLEAARDDDGRPTADGADFDSAEPGRRQAVLWAQGARRRRRRRRRDRGRRHGAAGLPTVAAVARQRALICRRARQSRRPFNDSLSSFVS